MPLKASRLLASLLMAPLAVPPEEPHTRTVQARSSVEQSNEAWQSVERMTVTPPVEGLFPSPPILLAWQLVKRKNAFLSGVQKSTLVLEVVP